MCMWHIVRISPSQSRLFGPLLIKVEAISQYVYFVYILNVFHFVLLKDVQKKLNLREDIASFLIKPVQRITKYQLLLKDMFKTSQKIGLNVPILEESLQLMKDVPKQANDAMALSMIIDYQGNIHANGQIIVQVWYIVYCRVHFLVCLCVISTHCSIIYTTHPMYWVVVM